MTRHPQPVQIRWQRTSANVIRTQGGCLVPTVHACMLSAPAESCDAVEGRCPLAGLFTVATGRSDAVPVSMTELLLPPMSSNSSSGSSCRVAARMPRTSTFVSLHDACMLDRGSHSTTGTCAFGPTASSSWSYTTGICRRMNSMCFTIVCLCVPAAAVGCMWNS